MKEVFEIHNPAYNFRTGATYFKRENVKKNHYGIQSVRYFGPKLWDTVPNNIKNCSSLNKFKISIKSWKPNECPYRLCKKYIAQAGFIWFTSSFCNISEEKKIIYILYFLRFFIYRFFNGKVSRGFPGYSFFFWQGRGQGGVGGGGRGCTVSADFFDNLSQSLRRQCISWGLPCWELCEIFVFLQWLSLSFVFVSMFLICLLFYCYYHY